MPAVFFGTALIASFLADADGERTHPRRFRRSDPRKPYVYETDCVHSDCESITAMQDAAREVSYETMLRHCDLPAWAEEMSYDARAPGLTLRRDWHIGYYRSFYRGRPCYFLVHSAIEYVWVERE